MVFLKFTVLNDFVFLVCLFAIHCYILIFICTFVNKSTF